MRTNRFTRLAALAAMVPAISLAGAGSAMAAPGAGGDLAAAPSAATPPRGPGGLTGGEDRAGIVTWCHGALQCLVVENLCAGIFVWDEENSAGEPTHGYCDDGVGSSSQAAPGSPVAAVAAAGRPGPGPGPVLGARCPEGTFLSPFEKPIYDEAGLFVVGYETVWFCLPEDLEPAG